VLCTQAEASMLRALGCCLYCVMPVHTGGFACSGTSSWRGALLSSAVVVLGALSGRLLQAVLLRTYDFAGNARCVAVPLLLYNTI
jgi:hypothetical protein